MELVKDYLENTSFHGLPFLTQPGRHWVERLFWLGCVLGSWYLCFQLIVTSYEGYRDNALSFGTDTDYNEWNTSFFSVAVCESKNKAGVYKYGEKLWGKKHDYNLDEILLEIAYFKGDHYFTKSFCPPGPKKLPCPQGDFKNLSDAVRSTCSEVFHSCEWSYYSKSESVDCCKYFLPLDTERGLCFAINSKQAKKQKALPLISNKYVGPGRMKLQLKVQAEVYIMAPEEVPFMNAPSVEWTLVQRGIFKHRGYSITEIVNGPQVRSVPIEQRMCRFPDENNLTMYPLYSYMACIVQCRAEKQLQLCGCVSHLSPGRDPSEFCNMTGILCLIDNYPLYSVLVNDWSDRAGMSCDCLPSCLEPEYDLIEDEDYGKSGPLGILELSLQRLPSIRLKRTVVRGPLDMVVSMGGSAGLFVGASLLSFVELVYFCTLRAWAHYARRKTQRNTFNLPLKNNQKWADDSGRRMMIPNLPNKNLSLHPHAFHF